MAINRHVRKFTRQLEMDLDGGTLQMSTCWNQRHAGAEPRTPRISIPFRSSAERFTWRLQRAAALLKFEDPRLSNFMAAPAKRENASPRHQRFVALQPKAGDLILFESWLRHEVPVNRSQLSRVSVSFNYEWV